MAFSFIQPAARTAGWQSRRRALQSEASIPATGGGPFMPATLGPDVAHDYWTLVPCEGLHLGARIEVMLAASAWAARKALWSGSPPASTFVM